MRARPRRVEAVTYPLPYARCCGVRQVDRATLDRLTRVVGSRTIVVHIRCIYCPPQARPLRFLPPARARLSAAYVRRARCVGRSDVRGQSAGSATRRAGRDPDRIGIEPKLSECGFGPSLCDMRPARPTGSQMCATHSRPFTRAESLANHPLDDRCDRLRALVTDEARLELQLEKSVRRVL